MNPVVGDKALLEHDRLEVWTKSRTETDKIRCHLSFALRELRKVSSSDDASRDSATAIVLDPQTQRRRLTLLSALEEYIACGRFPHHEDASATTERKPCFIDSGKIPCAVAHLMQESGPSGAALATTISMVHKHDTVNKIVQDDDEISDQLQSWAVKHGFQVSELALVQPTYEFVARECRRMFHDIMNEIKSNIEAGSPPLQPSKKNALARKIVNFGVEMQGGFGYPKADIPMYLKDLDELSGLAFNASSSDVLSLISVLRKEVTQEEGGTKPEDYIDLLSQEDLEYWKRPNCSNRPFYNRDYCEIIWAATGELPDTPVGESEIFNRAGSAFFLTILSLGLGVLIRKRYIGSSRRNREL